MSTYVDCEQNSQEWYEARKGRITASVVAAALGVCPFRSRKQAIKDLVAEAHGHSRNLDNVPSIRWGRDNEATAAGLYAMAINPDQVISKCGMWVVDLPGLSLGASPDRKVSGNGLLEIKCPYSKREATHESDFDSIHDLPHYWNQIQLQLFCSGREWCDFLQWAPEAYRCERVLADAKWFDLVKDKLLEFVIEVNGAEYDAPEIEDRTDETWAQAAREYAEIAPLFKAMEKKFKAAEKALKDLSDVSCSGFGVEMNVASVDGRTDYKAALEHYAPEADVSGFKTKPSLRKSLKVKS